MKPWRVEDFFCWVVIRSKNSLLRSRPWGTGPGQSGPSSKQFLNQANHDAAEAIYKLAKKGEKRGAVVSVEIDPNMYALAKEATARRDNVFLLNCDALKNKNTLNPLVLSTVAE